MKAVYLQNVRVKNALGTARTRKMESNDHTLALTLQNYGGEIYDIFLLLIKSICSVICQLMIINIELEE